MVDILHKIGIQSSLNDTYRALTTPEGLSAWWTNSTQDESDVGGPLKFRFGDRGGLLGRPGRVGHFGWLLELGQLRGRRRGPQVAVHRRGVVRPHLEVLGLNRRDGRAVLAQHVGRDQRGD